MNKPNMQLMLVISALIVICFTGCQKPPVIDKFYADSSIIFMGAEVDLHWSVSGADSIILKDNYGDTLATSGDSLAIHLQKRTTFLLIASNRAGSENRTVTVDVYPGRRGL